MADLNNAGVTNGNYVTARAWVNFNGNTATPSTIRSSFNVSSITRSATGTYDISYITGLGDGEYCILGMNGDYIASNATRRLAVSSAAAPTSGSCRIVNVAGADTGVAQNPVRAMVIIYR